MITIFISNRPKSNPFPKKQFSAQKVPTSRKLSTKSQFILYKNVCHNKKKKNQSRQNITVLPHRSLGSTSAPLWSRTWTTSGRPWQAAMWRAVRPSISWKLTLVPESKSCLIPSMSPSLAKYISLTLESMASSAASTAKSFPRSGFSEDCLPRVNLGGSCWGWGLTSIDGLLFLY
ncbi:hypothetical protein PanWU01x14_088460 [Parasponia andersonii]|uniref:Uncharacterized protein n=1 Tax=Parasponia andersonii TaxID=3476 RepID=A0A2P5D806_PARAD|nr:hypothetical protein PanWU01x14_088460 [Parasponia andersonii]